MAHNVVVNACPPRGKRVKRKSELVKLCLASWNIASLTGKSIELVKALHRRKISIACIQENKWVGAKAKELMGISCGIQALKEPQTKWAFWS